MLALVVPAGFGQRPWEKPPRQWTDADARQILSDSPWAKSIAIRTWKVTTRDGNTTIVQPEPLSATVRWESALPVRLALRKVGLSPAVSADYSRSAVVVVSLPKRWRDQSSVRVDSRTKPEASLKPTGLPALSPLAFMLLEQDDHQPLIAFTFAKSTDLVEPREIRLPFILQRNIKKLYFHARIGDWEVEQEFQLRGMTFLGKPEL